ncbi:MAG: LysR family transcriptional regulator [Nitrosomonas sp.]|uniref:LysR family transcriptional regulator n=1 Tax=Nitrosomonas sp. TaxID=42353 RepID=UPI002731E3B0|nr:LysR family transcriptional regulator [Nitrosomonas sp.]MBK6959610.1 LysR family transcriptional regulator [Nitrosomonas sp.]MDP1550907.1 LysR family transcriptional regulator [Nitrosomonas sp.]MDP1787031.1 LysR family transcriptional regulator [Nitrosomonas sp.]MDP1933327.1 LysR family transcriptional regulator [Nitrosomonas sp.]MDP3279915.1 LysR family transcriptional regulator [Nitrosomonas sp.]
MLHLTLRQLKVFESVARHLSYSRAADELHLTQPAVSMQIKQLEGNISLPLFEQLGKRIYLTDAGRELYQYSRSISQQLADMEVALDELKGMERGKLNISVVTTANYFAPHLLAKFCQRYKGVTVSLNVSNRETVLKQLSDNLIDLAIMGQPPEDLDIDSESFIENPLVVIAPPDHPLCREQNIPVNRLAKEVFLVRESGSGTRGAMERFFAAHDVKINKGMEADTTEAIKQAVQAGMGLGIMSQHTAELELETNRLKILDVQGFPIIRYWHVVNRKNKRLSGVANAFREFLLKEAAELMANSKK